MPAESMQIESIQAERYCLMTGKQADKGKLIRFVCAPDGQLVPDLAQKLGGRGAWVMADHEQIEQAIIKKKFAHHLKQKVMITDDFMDRLDKQLRAVFFNRLCFLNKAGALVAGKEAIKRATKIDGLFVGDDASKKETDTLCKAIKWQWLETDIPADLLGQVKGRNSLAYVAIRLPRQAHEKQAINQMKLDLMRWRGVHKNRK